MGDQYTEIITGDNAVINTLHYLIDARIVCKMEIPRSKYSWITMLLEVQHMGDSHYLLIDRVAGFESALSHLPDREVSLEFMDKGGVPCLFKTQVIECRPKEIWAELPKAIHRIQRRQYFRMDASSGTEITFFIGPSEERERAKVKDYSAGGAAFIIEKALNLSVGDLLTDIHLNIPAGKEWIHFLIPKATVRRVERDFFHGGRTIMAIEFMEISQEIRNNLISHIFKQQRVVIQRIKR